LPELREALSASGRYLFNIAGSRAWAINQKRFGKSALLSLGVGEVFSTVSRLEHVANGANGANGANVANGAVAVGRDCVSGSRVLVLWLDPARLRGDSVGLVASDGSTPFELTLAGGGGGPMPLEHGTVLMTGPPSTPGDDNGNGGNGAPLFAVGRSSASRGRARHGAPADDCSLVELRFFISAAVQSRCMLVRETEVRREIADAIDALLP
jgi:hypothetical protein